MDVRGAQATATVTPTIEAFIDDNVSMTNIGGNITVRADSVRAEGDTTARSYGGGVVDVGAANADTTVTPTVNAYIDTGATIDVDGAVTVEALARAQPLDSLRRHLHDRTRTPSTRHDHFPVHGLANGDTVTYISNGNPPITARRHAADHPRYGVIVGTTTG